MKTRRLSWLFASLRAHVLVAFIVVCLGFASHASSDRYYYDEVGRLIRVERSEGIVVTYTYDDVGNRLSKSVVYDADFDDVDDSNDNCLNTPNTDQFDDDGDLAGAACDCDDMDPHTYPNAQESNDGEDNQCSGSASGFGLIDELSGIAVFNNKETFSWSTQFGATLYEVARSTRRDFSQDCVMNTTTEVFWVDSDPLTIGQPFYYLARAVAPNVGSWGAMSNEVERVLGCGSPVAAGDVQTSSPLLIGKESGDEIKISWGPSCFFTDDDFEIYAGVLGEFTTHSPVTCSTDGVQEVVFLPSPDDRYYLVVPRNGSREGAYGTDSSGTPRPQGNGACLEQSAGSCP